MEVSYLVEVKSVPEERVKGFRTVRCEVFNKTWVCHPFPGCWHSAINLKLYQELSTTLVLLIIRAAQPTGRQTAL